ncbi:MAG TPA: alkaline phosphatase family protein [Conexibacter sp.]
MSALQLRAVAVLSLLCTLVVLGAGRQGDGRADAATVLAAQHEPVTIDAPGPVASSEPTGESSGDDADDGASSANEVATLDDGAATPVETTPSEDEDGDGGSGETDDEADEPQPTKIRHVFLIVLAGRGYEATFGAGAPATYLNGTLRPKGTLLTGYSTLGRAGLADALAIVGGQPPNADTRADCPVYREIPPTAAPSRTGEIAADGCVFPNTVTTIADQLSASRRAWKAYVEDLDRGPAPGAGGIGSPKTTCRHPGSNAADDTLRARPGDGYATRRNPFVYYHSLLDLGDCDANDGALGALEADLAGARRTPNLAYIAPNLCNDGSESPCVDGTPGGLAAADAFLATWVPKILASPAYRADGLLIVAFAGDVTPPDPAAPPPDPAAPVRTGALLVSKYAQPGGTAGSDYDPYALLRSLQDLFALTPLARAATASSFAPTVLADAYVTPPSDG